MQQTTDPQKPNEKLAAKLSLVAALKNGTNWREAAKTSGLTLSRTSAYRYRKGYEARGEAALWDGRQGHPSKFKPPMQQWLAQYCRDNPQLTSPQLQKALQEQFAQTLSVSYLDEVRRKLKLSRQALAEAVAPDPLKKTKT